MTKIESASKQGNQYSRVKSGVMRRLPPGTKLGRATLWSGIVCACLIALRWITSSAPESPLGDWTTIFILIFACLAALLALRWVRRMLLWRLRNRLIVAYIFIGVTPILLLITMAALSGYLFSGQFAAYIAASYLQSELRHMEAANDALAAQLNTLHRSGKLNEQTAGILITVSGENFPQRTVTALQGDRGFTLSAAGALPAGLAEQVPDAIKGDFSGLVMDHESLHLRAVKRYSTGFTVISNVPITSELLAPASSNLGVVTLLLPDPQGNVPMPPPDSCSASANHCVKAGSTPAPANRFDRSIQFLTFFTVVDWKSGKTKTGGILIMTRPSMLYNILFATLGEKVVILRYILLGIVILFGFIELVALIIGIRLSRSMTRSVAQLYSATKHINRGDLTHRIDVRSHDQMAELQQSFNSMTESLVNLMAEQKEKQRLESELAIAHEVQNLLFPRQFTGAPSLEVYGVCRPARSVSGDYYDFIPLGAHRLVLAVGDISGKGISAALLMATVHAFVRAYSLEPDIALTPAAGTALSSGDAGMYYRGDGVTQEHLAPGMLMTTLNYQLFRSTPPEKYATMFLACYDSATHILKYCNAGHLPPVLLRSNGDVLRLETSGTVVGLFDGIGYGESTVAMSPGDLFAAFSDGVTEPENESGEFGEERLIELLQQKRDQPLARIGEAITSSVTEWIGKTEQPDDVTIVLARAR